MTALHTQRISFKNPSLRTLRKNYFWEAMQANDGILSLFSLCKVSFAVHCLFSRGYRFISRERITEHQCRERLRIQSNPFLSFTDGNKQTQWSRKVSVWRNRDSETQIPDRRTEEVPWTSQSPGTGSKHVLHFDGGMRT